MPVSGGIVVRRRRRRVAWGRIPSKRGPTVAIDTLLSRKLRHAAVAEAAVPLEQQLGAQYNEDAAQSGSRQALLSTAQGDERVADPKGMRPLVDQQPWKGVDIAAGEWVARRNLSAGCPHSICRSTADVLLAR